jgi:hypothetical protein
MSDIKLMRIEPIEYDPKGKYPRIKWYRNLSFNKRLTLEMLNKIKQKLKIEREITVSSNTDRFLFWHYKGEPPIILDRLEGTINTTVGALNTYGLRACQQRASILLRILRKYKQANFKQVSVSSYRIGDTPERRREIFEAYERLFFKKIKK